MLRLSYKKRRRFSRPLLRVFFFQVSKAWQLNAKEEMRFLGTKSYRGFKKRREGKVVLTNAELEILGWVFNMYQDLYILFPNNREARHGWLKRKPNKAPIFGGKSAMEYIMEGDFPTERILAVRNYLASQLV